MLLVMYYLLLMWTIIVDDVGISLRFTSWLLYIKVLHGVNEAEYLVSWRHICWLDLPLNAVFIASLSYFILLFFLIACLVLFMVTSLTCIIDIIYVSTTLLLSFTNNWMSIGDFYFSGFPSE